MSDNKEIPIYRLVILGVSGVGKTQIVNQFVNNCFNPIHEETFEDLRPYRKLLNLGTEKSPVYCLVVIEDIFPTNHPQIEGASGIGEQSEAERIFSEIIDNASAKEKKDKEEKKLSKIYLKKQIYGFVFVFDASLPTQEMNKGLKNIDNIVKFINNAEGRGVNGEFITKKVILGNKKELISEQEMNAIRTNPIVKETGLTLRFVSARFNEDITSVFQDLCKQIQEDPKILIMEEEWQKEQSEESKDDDKNQKASGKEEEDEDGYRQGEGKIIFDEEFMKYPQYQTQGVGMDGEGCSIF